MSEEQDILSPDVSTDEYLDKLMPKKKMGRPIKSGSGSAVFSVSMPYLMRKVAEKYRISLSDAIQEGVLMLLNNNEQFQGTEDPYEITLKKGLFFDKRQAFTRILNKTITGDSKVRNEVRNDIE